MEPKVSIVIPTYNRAHIIGETLDSIKSQTHENWECFVVDDGSSDGTEELVKKYSDEDPRFQFLKRPADREKGANACRNIGIENSTGEYVQILDSDDLLAPDKFEVQLRALKKASSQAIATCKWGNIRAGHTNAKLYHGLATYFGTKNPIELLKVYGNRFTFFPPHVFLVPREVVEKAGPWKEDLLINQDGEFFARVILQSSEIIFCEDTFVLYRSGAGGRTTSKKKSDKRRKHYIKSIELIDESIKKMAGVQNHPFVKQRKAEFFYKLKKENPDLLQKQKSFFHNKTSGFMYLFSRFVSGMKNKASRKVENIEFTVPQA